MYQEIHFLWFRLSSLEIRVWPDIRSILQPEPKLYAHQTRTTIQAVKENPESVSAKEPPELAQIFRMRR